MSVFLWFFCKLLILFLWDYCQICLRTLQENIIISIDQFLGHVMTQLSDTNVTSYIDLWYIMISEIRNIFTKIWSQHNLKPPIFINVSFIWFYTLPGMYFPFLAIIGFNPPCSHKYCFLSIKNCLFFSILVFLILNGHKGSLIWFFWAHQISTNNKSLFSLNKNLHYFLSQFSNPPSTMK